MPTPDQLPSRVLSEFSAFVNDISGWPYYALCGLFFISCGLAAGYFIWRKGHLQTLDVESEVRETGKELIKLREDLEIEEEELSPGHGLRTGRG